MINLDGAVVIVTGSASGTGAATALCLAGKGANVVVNYSRSKEKAEEVANSTFQFRPAVQYAMGNTDVW